MRLNFRILVLALAVIPNLIIAQLKPLDYSDGSQKLSGFIAKPHKSLTGKPGVLVLPAWFGIDNHSKESTEELSKLGYYSFVADIYGIDKRPTNSGVAGKNAGYYKKNIQEHQKRIQLALDQLVMHGANPDKIVVIGYCFGGTGAIEAARMNMKVSGIVSFHGGLGRDDSRLIETIKAKVLVLHGADDPYVPEAEIKLFQDEMKKSKSDWQMVYYANSVHAFTEKTAGNDNSKGAAYNELADKRSKKAMLEFLKEVL